MTNEPMSDETEKLATISADAFVRHLREQIAGEQYILDKVKVWARSFPTGHMAHWDAQGNRGATCPLCIEQRKALEILRSILTEAAVPNNALNQNTEKNNDRRS